MLNFNPMGDASARETRADNKDTGRGTRCWNGETANANRTKNLRQKTTENQDKERVKKKAGQV